MKRSIWEISPASPVDMVWMKENELYKWELLTMLQEIEQ